MPQPAIPFHKYEGASNDFIIVSSTLTPGTDWSSIAPRMCDRRRGVGADGILLIDEVEPGVPRMTVINSDGSEAGMCGNGLRCVVQYLADYGQWTRQSGNAGPVMTRDGLRHATVNHTGTITLNMGQPKFARQDIPAQGASDTTFLSQPITIGANTWVATALSMGNPHCVIFVDDWATTPVTAWGKSLERHAIFPDRANIEFVQCLNRHEVNARVWERGAGETMACGTGACAIVVAGVLTKRLERHVTVHLPGGPLEVDWRNSGEVYLTGSARHVYDGHYKLLE